MPAVKKTANTEDVFAKPEGVYAKLAYIQTHLSNVEKTGRNEHHKYNYMQEHGLIDLLRPFLRLLNCAVILSPAQKFEREGNTVMLLGSLTFTDADEHPYMLGPEGQPFPGPGGDALVNPNHSIVARFAGEGMDPQDKATNKAHTSFAKYALQKFFLVPTEHVDDSDSDDVRDAARQATGTRPVSVADVDAALAQIKAGVASGKLDRNKVGAKVATLGGKRVPDLSAENLDSLRSWLDEQEAS